MDCLYKKKDVLHNNANNGRQPFKGFLNPLMHSGSKRSFVREQTCSLKLQVCSSMYRLLPPCIKGLKLVFLARSQNS